ncbi:alpha/beta hydrolase [Pedobacter psychrodurus]|uniref:alpha/beta hydrolase n=1 Tax=Pedobacter psychrodurus TaxID=2530456 RepID=UPI002930694F|nr:alpha/beta hydrolase-fold protein [Pedobacter psychrodurus]
MKLYFLIAGYLFFLSSASFAQTQNDSKPFVLGKTEQIHSIELNETRTLNIYLPEGYSRDSTNTYPVIYLLDGSANEDFIHIAGLVQFLTMIEKMPKAIVVGIANIDRKRDFTFPTTVKKDLIDYPTTGKSEKFIAFIEKELQPFIAEKYKANSSKTIIGQSLGGLLAAEILLKKPELFNNYIIISPSLWWNNESLLTDATKAITNIKPDTKIYISVGEEGKQMKDDAKKLADLIQMNKKLKTTFIPLVQETHLTILHNSAYKGLEIVFNNKN